MTHDNLASSSEADSHYQLSELSGPMVMLIVNCKVFELGTAIFQTYISNPIADQVILEIRYRTGGSQEHSS
jgi:hypothetical protein